MGILLNNHAYGIDYFAAHNAVVENRYVADHIYSGEKSF